MSHPFTLDFEVRDYECDLQGIVNNAVYLNYLEHARHVFLKSRGCDFAELARQKINLVVVRIELDYVRSLGSGDRFRISVETERVSRLRFGFIQEIRRLPNNEVILRGRVIGTSLNEEGKPTLMPEVARLWDDP
jgi:acyl-CoA thioester hydrolase